MTTTPTFLLPFLNVQLTGTSPERQTNYHRHLTPQVLRHRTNIESSGQGRVPLFFLLMKSCRNRLIFIICLYYNIPSHKQIVQLIMIFHSHPTRLTNYPTTHSQSRCRRTNIRYASPALHTFIKAQCFQLQLRDRTKTSGNLSPHWICGKPSFYNMSNYAKTTYNSL